MFIIYYVLNGISSSGSNSAVINLIYDEVDVNHRTEAYAIKNALTGIIGFTVTSIAAIFVQIIQSNGGIMLFGFNLYAQQFLSIIATIIKVSSLVYIMVLWKSKLKSTFNKS